MAGGRAPSGEAAAWRGGPPPGRRPRQRRCRSPQRCFCDALLSMKQEPDPRDADRPSDGPRGLRRRQQYVPELIPTVHGPLDIYREDLEKVWDILQSVFESVKVYVVARGGQGYDADDIASLAELADEQIDQVRFNLEAGSESDSSWGRSGWLRILTHEYPRCDYSDGSTWTAREREAIRNSLDHLRYHCRSEVPYLRRHARIIAVVLGIIWVTISTTGSVLVLRTLAAPRTRMSVLAAVLALLLLVAALWHMLVDVGGKPNDRIRIVPVYRSQRPPSFWQRNMNELLLRGLLVLVAGIVGGIISRLLK
jgi:hypothetical protein